MVWRATTWIQGLPIFGADRLVDSQGEMRWKWLGLLPVMQATGDDVARSAANGSMTSTQTEPIKTLLDPGLVNQPLREFLGDDAAIMAGLNPFINDLT
jgi:hypothetical protein